MAFLVVKRFRACHGLQGKDPSDDQYDINHCFGGDFWGYSSNEYTIAGNTSRHITHPSDFVCWFIPSMGHLVRRFTALLTTWLLKGSWQPIKAHSNELCLITCWKHPVLDEWILGNCSIRINLVLLRQSWPVSVKGWKIWLISRHPMLSSSSTPAKSRQLLSVFHRSGGHSRFGGDEVSPYQSLRTNELLTRSHTETDHQRHA